MSMTEAIVQDLRNGFDPKGWKHLNTSDLCNLGIKIFELEKWTQDRITRYEEKSKRYPMRYVGELFDKGERMQHLQRFLTEQFLPLLRIHLAQSSRQELEMLQMFYGTNTRMQNMIVEFIELGIAEERHRALFMSQHRRLGQQSQLGQLSKEIIQNIYQQSMTRTKR